MPTNKELTERIENLEMMLIAVIAHITGSYPNVSYTLNGAEELFFNAVQSYGGARKVHLNVKPDHSRGVDDA